MFINNNGVYGLSGSGFDVEGTVEKLMQTERSKYDKMYQKKEKLTWQKDAYRETNTAISAFRDKVFDMKLKANMDLKKATSSNESAVSVTGTSNAINGTNTIEVSQLAEGASIGSQDPVVGLVDGKFDFGADISSKQFTINGKTITVKNGDSAESVASKINAANIGAKASYDATLNRFFLSTSKTGENATIELEDSDGFMQDNLKMTGLTGSAVPQADLDIMKSYLTSDNKFDFGGDISKTFTINGKTVTVNKDDTLDDLNKTLKAAGAGVAIRGDKNGLRAGTLLTGKNAEFKLNNISLTQETNKFTISGLSYNLKAKTTDAVTISTTVDTDKIYEQIKGFMDDYNKLIADLNGKIDEKTFRDYPPLTEQQKEDMSEDEIKAWNKKAQSGLLKGDTTLSSLLSSMRLELSNPLKMVSSNNDAVVTANVTSKANFGTNTVNVTKLATNTEVKATLAATLTDGKIDFGAEGVEKTFKINDKEIKVKHGDTLDSLNQAMANSGAGVSITCSRTETGADLTFTSTTFGSSSNIKFEGEAGILSVDETTRKIGENATYTIKDKNGKFLDRDGKPTDNDPGLTSESNNVEVGGIKYSFQGVGTTTVTVSGSQLTDFGIETGSYDTNGKLVFSDVTGDKLKEMIEADPDAVINFFTRQSKGDTVEKGLAQRLQETLDKTMKQLKEKAGASATYADQSVLGKQIGNLETDLKDELKRLKVVEQNYYNEYSKMEVYINQMLQQSNMFSTYAG